MPIGQSDEAIEAASLACMTIDLIEANETSATARNAAVQATKAERGKNHLAPALPCCDVAVKRIA